MKKTGASGIVSSLALVRRRALGKAITGGDGNVPVGFLLIDLDEIPGLELQELEEDASCGPMRVHLILELPQILRQGLKKANFDVMTTCHVRRAKYTRCSRVSRPFVRERAEISLCQRASQKEGLSISTSVSASEAVQSECMHLPIACRSSRRPVQTHTCT